jgi:hypothetical protein
MRGLALATLFLGLGLIDPGPDIDKRTVMAFARTVLFLLAMIVIWSGA